MDELTADPFGAPPAGILDFDPYEEIKGYWAAKPSDSCWEHLLTKVDEYFSALDQSPFSGWVARNWCYYHNFFKGLDEFRLNGGAILKMGAQGELSFLGIPHFRNLLQHIYILTTRDRPNPQCRAATPDHASLRDCTTTDAVLEYYLRDLRAEKYLYRAAEQAIVLTAGFVGVEWDASLGEPYVGDVQTRREITEGDLALRNYTVFDVVRDLEITIWEENDWIIVRDWPNKWNLAALHPEKATEILNSTDPMESEWGLYRDREKSERVSRWTFYHRPTPAVPKGRRLRFTRAAWLEDGPLPEELKGKIPVYRCCPNEVLLTSDGWSPGFDLQGIQEAINMIASALTTNLDSFAVQNIWTPTTSPVRQATLTHGLRLLQSKQKPEPLQLTANPKDAYAYLEMMVRQGETVSAINSVRRGTPEKSLDSGRALSVVEAKSIEFLSGAIQSYYQLVEDVCTCMVRILGAHQRTRKHIQIQGQFNTALQEYGAETFQKVDRVVVDAGNPLTRTLAGKLDLAEKFLDKGWLRVPEEIEMVLNTGRLDPILQADTAQLLLIASEKETLLRGELAPVLKTDYHSLHMREEVALLSTPEVRQQEQLSANVLSHVLTHAAMLYLPDVIDLQSMMGYQAPQVQPGLAPAIMQQIDPAQLGATDLKPNDVGFLTTPPQTPAQQPNRKGGGMGSRIAEQEPQAVAR